MRDPFERLVSHYRHNVSDVVHGGELRPLLKAVKERADYLASGNYAMQRTSYLDRFGPQALYALTFEALIEDPQRKFDRLCRWPGLPPAPMAREKSTAHNQRPQAIAGGAGLDLPNRIEYSILRDRVSSTVPVSLKTWVKRHAYTSVDARETERFLPALRAEFGDPLHRWVENLSRLLGQAFPEWETTHPIAATRASLDRRWAPGRHIR